MSECGSNWARQTEQSWSPLLRLGTESKRTVGVWFRNCSMYVSAGVEWKSEKSSRWLVTVDSVADDGSGCGDDDDVESRNPKMWRIVRMKFLKMEMVRAAFTKIMHSIPSDAAGRLERPMSMRKKKESISRDPQTKIQD